MNGYFFKYKFYNVSTVTVFPVRIKASNELTDRSTIRIPLHRIQRGGKDKHYIIGHIS